MRIEWKSQRNEAFKKKKVEVIMEVAQENRKTDEWWKEEGAGEKMVTRNILRGEEGCYPAFMALCHGT